MKDKSEEGNALEVEEVKGFTGYMFSFFIGMELWN